ncbi:MAG: hypothetical protein WCP97_08590 [bacterium]
MGGQLARKLVVLHFRVLKCYTFPERSHYASSIRKQQNHGYVAKEVLSKVKKEAKRQRRTVSKLIEVTLDGVLRSDPSSVREKKIQALNKKTVGQFDEQFAQKVSEVRKAFHQWHIPTS